MTIDERARLLEPHGRRRGGALDAARRLGQQAEREAFDRQARHLVAHPEFAVQPVGEVHDEAAREDGRLRQHARVLLGAPDPLGRQIHDERGRAVGADRVGVRLQAAAKQHASPP